jgi:hypothetical protein
MINSFIFLLLLSLTTPSTPNASCDELIRYTKSEGTHYGSVGALSLMNSEWLKNVEAYKVEDVIVVIASIKKEGSYFSKDYIFCSVPESNWRSFSSYFGNDSYGEKFHQYIFNYQCDCN